MVVTVTWVAWPGASQLSVWSGIDLTSLLGQCEGFGVGVQINKEARGCPVKCEFLADNE